MLQLGVAASELVVTSYKNYCLDLKRILGIQRQDLLRKCWAVQCHAHGMQSIVDVERHTCDGLAVAGQVAAGIVIAESMVVHDPLHPPWTPE